MKILECVPNFSEGRNRKTIDAVADALQRVGGVSEWMRVAALADASRLPVTPHVFHEVSVHLASAVPNATLIEHVPWWDRLWVEPLPVVEATVDEIAFAIVEAERESTAAYRRADALKRLYKLAREAGCIGADRAATAVMKKEGQ